MCYNPSDSMVDIAVEVSENLFRTWVGLTASGYDLANKADKSLQSLIASIRALDLDSDTLRFFKQARTDKYSVNPYWPRGSSLSSASLFIGAEGQFDADGYLAFEKSSGASNEHEDIDFRSWIKRLPVFLRAVGNHEKYPVLWRRYQATVNSRVAAYRPKLRLVSQCLAEFGVSRVPGRKLVFMPNLLQLHSMADFVLKAGRLYIITTHPVVSTMIHECLHPFVARYRNILRRFASTDDFAVFANEARMRAMGYQWDESVQAKIRVLEESVVRGLSIVLARDTESEERFCQTNVETGFVLVPSVVEHAGRKRPSLIELSSFIEGALQHHLSAVTSLRPRLVPSV